MSSFRISSIADCARLAAGLSSLLSMRTSASGTICHDTPKRSTSHPPLALPSAVRRQRRPQAVGFVLVLRQHRDGCSGSEGVVRPAVQDHVRRAGQGELHDQGGRVGARPGDGVDRAARQQRDVELRGFLAPAIEPQARTHLRGEFPLGHPRHSAAHAQCTGDRFACRAPAQFRHVVEDRRPIIAPSARHETDDRLWFSLVHEAAHILLHGKKSVFNRWTRRPPGATSKPPASAQPTAATAAAPRRTPCTTVASSRGRRRRR